MKDIMLSLGKLVISEKQNEIFSKVSGRENYVIKLYDGKVVFYGTKGQYKKTCYYNTWIPLKDAFRMNTLYFTYKKDWIEALKKLDVEL